MFSTPPQPRVSVLAIGVLLAAILGVSEAGSAKATELIRLAQKITNCVVCPEDDTQAR